MKYKLLIICLSFKWMFKINLGDIVWYNNEQYFVNNGVYPESWYLISICKSKDMGWIKRTKCKKVKSFKNYIGSFKSGYKFYMSNWFSIWEREGIKPWM